MTEEISFAELKKKFDKRLLIRKKSTNILYNVIDNESKK
jgi:hypothetical protein